METTTDDYGNLVYFDDCTGDVLKECCALTELEYPYSTCGDCWGGTDRDPAVNGSAYGWNDIRDELANAALEPWERVFAGRI